MKISIYIAISPNGMIFTLVMEPVLFGSGLPLLNNIEMEAKLNLLDIEKLNNNTIQLHYATR